MTRRQPAPAPRAPNMSTHPAPMCPGTSASECRAQRGEQSPRNRQLSQLTPHTPPFPALANAERSEASRSTKRGLGEGCRCAFSRGVGNRRRSNATVRIERHPKNVQMRRYPKPAVWTYRCAAIPSRPLGRCRGKTKKALSHTTEGFSRFYLAPTYFPTRYHAVSSAMEGLTTGFGMGPGVPPPPWAPRKFGEP